MSASILNLPNKQLTKIVYSSSTSFSVPEGVHFVHVEGWGGGAGGSNTNFNEGGGAGHFSSVLLQVVPGLSITVTIGVGGVADAIGGTSSFGSVIFRGGDIKLGGGRIAQNALETYGSRGSFLASGGTTNANGGGGNGGVGVGGNGGTNGTAGGIAAGGGGGSTSAGSGGSGQITIYYAI